MPGCPEFSDGPRSRAHNKAMVFLVALSVSLLYLPGGAQEEEEAEFKGVGVHLRLYGAWALFSGGDFKKGVSGMFDRIAADLCAAGYECPKTEGSFTSGLELGGDVVYCFVPWLGVGFGGSYTSGNKSNSIGIANAGLKLISLRLGLFLSLPLNRWLSLSANGGPAWYSAKFKYSESVTTPSLIDALSQEAKARHWGVQGGIGLEFRMNRKLGFILIAQGRYARISGFEGAEAAFYWEDQQSNTEFDNGTLYLLDEGVYPQLDIIEGPEAALLKARKAEFDFSGVSFQAGLNFKF
jgi:hypothetical protein